MRQTKYIMSAITVDKYIFKPCLMGAVSTPQQSFYVFEIHSSMLAYCNWEAGAQKDSPPITGRIFLLRNLTRSTTFHNLANYYSGAYPDSLMNY